MTREEWNAAQPVLTRALFLSPEEQQAVLESAFVSEHLRRHLLDVLLQTARVLPLASLTPSGSGSSAGSDPISGRVSLDTPEPPSPPLLSPGQPLGTDERFVVVRQLGRGGMGEVYLAHDRTLGNLVALKVLYEIELREAQHARSASGHPHIVTMYDVLTVELGGRPRTVLVLEYIAGKPASHLVDDGPIPLRNAVRWAREVASAMAHAHDRGVLHCDLKPANVLVTPEDGAKVLDFGIGRATFDRSNPLERLRGTLPYMAPEQLRERRFSQAGDVYSLGVTLFEMVTGRRPFDGSTPELMLQIVGTEPPRASSLRSGVLATLDDVLERALAKDPDVRYRTPRAMDRALQEVEDELTSPVPTPIAPIPRAPFHPPGYVVPIAVVLLALTVLGFFISTAFDSGLERRGVFGESPLNWPLRGAMALTVPVLAVGAAAVLLVAGTPFIRQIGRLTPVAAAARYTGRLIESSPTTALAHTLLVANVLALLAFVMYFLPLLRALEGFTTGNAEVDIGLLSRRYEWLHENYRMFMTLLLAVFGTGWFRLIRLRRQRRESEVLPPFVGGALVMTIALLIHVMPHRILWAGDYEQVAYKGQNCSVVGEADQSLLLFCPLATPRTLRIGSSEEGLLRTGRVEKLFTPLDSLPPSAPPR